MLLSCLIDYAICYYNILTTKMEEKWRNTMGPATKKSQVSDSNVLYGFLCRIERGNITFGVDAGYNTGYNIGYNGGAIWTTLTY